LAEEFKGYLTDLSPGFQGANFWEHSQYIPFLTAEKLHTICDIRPSALRADVLTVHG
jgi:hypothetical protein